MLAVVGACVRGGWYFHKREAFAAPAPLMPLPVGQPSGPVASGDQDRPPPPLAARVQSEPAVPPTPTGGAIVSEWTGRPPVALWSVARSQNREGISNVRRIPLRLSDRREGIMNVDKYDPTEEDGGVFLGALEGYPGSTVIMSFVGRSQAGVVLLPAEHRAFNYRAGEDGILRVTELDTMNAPGCGEMLLAGGAPDNR